MKGSDEITLAMAKAESEKIYIDPDTGGVHVFYAGPSETWAYKL